MPTPITKKREELRSRFVRNAIPTEGDYADLIAASLNQAEDGLLKLPNQPLALLAPNQPEKPNDPIALLNVLADPAAADPSWQLQLTAGDKPGIGLANQTKNTRLFLDGTTGNLGVGTATPAQRLTVEGPWNTGKDPANTLSNGGQLAIKGDRPQLDFIDSDQNEPDWAIHVNDGKLSFIRSPWEDKNLVLDGAGNVGVGTDTPTAKLHVVGNMCVQGALELRGDVTLTGSGRLPLRRVWFATDNSRYQHGFTNGQIAGRVLRIKKEFSNSILRIVYCDNHTTAGGSSWSGARWEVRLYGNTPTKQNDYDQLISLQTPIYLDRNAYNSANPSVLSSIIGYVRSIPQGRYEIRVFVSPVPGPGNGLTTTGTGWDGSTWSLEAEEILQNTL